MDDIDLNFNNKFNSLVSNYSQVAIPTKKKIRSERSELVKFFLDNLRDKNNKPFKVGFIVQKLSHIKTPDLYFVKSVFRDTLMRKGLDSASREFWWSIRV